MVDIIQTAEMHHDVLRKQIIIIRANGFAKGDELMRLREHVIEQMKGGVVVLPNTVTATVADADALVLMEKQLQL